MLAAVDMLAPEEVSGARERRAGDVAALEWRRDQGLVVVQGDRVAEAVANGNRRRCTATIPLTTLNPPPISTLPSLWTASAIPRNPPPPCRASVPSMLFRRAM